MDYRNAREFISSLSGRGICPGLMSIRKLCDKLGNPQTAFKAVHIAGTNGKGSTGAFLESILTADGKNICRFVSPAVGDYLEAFTYNGKAVSEKLYSECVQEVKAAVIKYKLRPTSFEAETAVAFLIFKKLAPDYALIECGMGGRLDSTNIIPTPKLAVVASISLDHTAFLGDTIEKIAYEKSGIIKEGGVAVTSVSQRDYITGKNVIYSDLPQNEQYGDTETSFEFEGDTYRTKLCGRYQPYNAALAIKSAKLLNIPERAIKDGIYNAVWQYRFERTGKYILDGAHNDDASKKLAQSLKDYIKSGRTAYICGCFRDKDYTAIVKNTAELADAVYCITLPPPRGLCNEILCKAFTDAGAEAYTANSLHEAIQATKDFDNILIFGSLSYLSEAKRLIEGT